MTPPPFTERMGEEEEALLEALFVRSRTGVPGDPETQAYRVEDSRRLLWEYLSRRDSATLEAAAKKCEALHDHSHGTHSKGCPCSGCYWRNVTIGAMDRCAAAVRALKPKGGGS